MSLLSLLLSVAAISATPSNSDTWDYPAGGQVSSEQHSLGKAGEFHSYSTVTKDSPEKVILWYAKRLGLSENNSVVIAAEAGFGKLKVPHEGRIGIVRDTDAEKWGALFNYNLSADYVHANLFVRPENDAENDLAISIHQSPQGTTISVIQSVHRKDTDKAASPSKP
jgi:hypothetical protein